MEQIAIQIRAASDQQPEHVVTMGFALLKPTIPVLQYQVDFISEMEPLVLVEIAKLNLSDVVYVNLDKEIVLDLSHVVQQQQTLVVQKIVHFLVVLAASVQRFVAVTIVTVLPVQFVLVGLRH